MPFKERIFWQEDLVHLLLLLAGKAAAISSLERKNKECEVRDTMLSRGSILFVLDVGSTLVSLIICKCSDSSAQI